LERNARLSRLAHIFFAAGEGDEAEKNQSEADEFHVRQFTARGGKCEPYWH